MSLRFISSSLILFALFILPASVLAQGQFQMEEAFEELAFDRPVDIQNAGDGSDRLFVVEQHQGRIWVFDNDENVSDATLFLDLNNQYLATANEEGLLGLAFHPDFANNGHFFVYYSEHFTARQSVISRFTVDPNNPNATDPNSELVILTIPQRWNNHNGGQLAFHPTDGYLYISVGDEGSGGDPDGNGQNRAKLSGSILRIDVNNSTAAEPYRIPADNPFVGNSNGYREEIFAYGLRNPWRMSIDPVTGDIWTGDVGQESREEINIIVKGGNYGWNIMEGSLCYNPSQNCDTTNLILPVHEYARALGISVTGGHVYRGSRVPELVGKYIYSDFANGNTWALTVTPTDTTNQMLINAWFNIAAFGVDESNELYIAGFDGKIYRFEATVPTNIEETPDQELATLGTSFPNPTSGQATIPFYLDKTADIELSVFDLLGRRIQTLVQGTYTQGQHEAIWTPQARPDGSLLPNGAYFYSLRVDQQVVATRMLSLAR